MSDEARHQDCPVGSTVKDSFLEHRAVTTPILSLGALDVQGAEKTIASTRGPLLEHVGISACWEHAGAPGPWAQPQKPALSLFRVLLRMKDGSQAGDLLIQQANTTGFYKAAAARQAGHRLPFLARFCHLLAAP